MLQPKIKGKNCCRIQKMIEDYLFSIPIIATYQTKNSSLADGKTDSEAA